MNEIEVLQSLPPVPEITVPELEHAPTPTTPPPTSILRRIFLGDDGLRAGWSVLLFLILVVIISLTANSIVSHLHLIPKAAATSAQPRETQFRPMFTGETISASMLILAAWIMSLIERRPFVRYGFVAKRSIPDFLIGLFWGFLCLSLLVGTLVLTHTLAFDGVLLHGQPAITFAFKWFLGFLMVGLSEEFLFRGYFQYTVARGVAGVVRAFDPANKHSFQLSFWISALLFSGIFFMVAHLGNAGETASGIMGVGLAGAVFVFSLYRTGSLWWAVGFHTTWDWAQSYLYGVPDSATMVQGHLLASHPMGSALLSGGTAGPEGSILIIPTLLLVGLIIHLTLPKRDYPITPDQTAPTPPPPVEATF